MKSIENGNIFISIIKNYLSSLPMQPNSIDKSISKISEKRSKEILS